MYFNMVRTELLEMCSLGPSNPPPLPPTTLSPYLNPNQSEKFDLPDILDCSNPNPPPFSKLYGQHLMEIKLHSITYLLRGSNTEFSRSECNQTQSLPFLPS